MVMEASPSPQSVGREFVRQYYTLLNKAPAHLHRFYNNYSSFVHGGLDAPNRETLPVVGQKQIHNRIQQLNFRDCHAKISQVDAQATLGNGVVVQVTGELSNGGAPMRRFTQTFVLAAQSPKKYYVHNDIFRYQDIVFSDDSGSASGRSEGEEEEPTSGGYFPQAAFSAPFPAPPAVPAAAPLPAPPAPPAPHVQQPLAPQPQQTTAIVSSPPAPHVNGHPPALEDTTRHLVQALQASSLSHSAPEREPEPEPVPEPVAEPEPPREPSPPPAPPAAPEPKTYANLLKSSSNMAPRPQAPPAAAPPAPQHAAHAPHAAPPADQRAPRQRVSRDNQPPTAEGNPGPGGAAPPGGSRRYSDAQQLFLGNLPHSATEEALRALFARFGPVAELRVHSKPAAAGAPRHPNYGFITYETAQAAHDCLNAAPLYFPPDSADGVKLNVEEKKTRGRDAPRPPRRPLSSNRGPPRPNYRR
ncbi:hypothetical protein O0L34_g16994 [Tuta absoluta]|nr:hypothetical protein O0L34_g16994 [Tuta absoluta]